MDEPLNVDLEPRKLGDRSVTPVGLGAMWLSLTSERPSREEAVGVIHAALDLGANLIDTADAYALDATEMGHNERLIADALATWSGDRSDVVVATKGGHVRDTAGGWALNGTRDYLLTSCERSIKSLGVEQIDVYYLHRPDPETPVGHSAAALQALVDEGLVKYVGLSNVSVPQIRQAQAHCALAAVSNEFSPRYRASHPAIDYCQQEGLAFIAWRTLGGINHPEERAASYSVFDEVATRHRVSPQQIALAWARAQADNVIVIPGATRTQTFTDCFHSLQVRLTEEEMSMLGATPHRDVPS